MMRPRHGIEWRRPEERYGIYRLVPDATEADLVATTPTAEGVGVTLVTLAAEGEFDGCAVGVLDSHGDASVAGTWVVNPWGRGRAR